MFELLPGILTAQALGVIMAVSTHAMTWQARSDGKNLAAASLSCSAMVFPLLLPFVLAWGVLNGETLGAGALCSAGWLVILAIIQSNQYGITFKNALSGATFQFVFFGLGLLVGHFVRSSSFSSAPPEVDWPYIYWLASATLSYAIISLFRPTLIATIEFATRKENRPSGVSDDLADS